MITKAKVLEVFMRLYGGGTPDREDSRRALLAYNAALDELVPFKRGMSSSEEERKEAVIGFLIEILKEDFGIELRLGRKITGIEEEGVKEAWRIGPLAREADPDRLGRFPEGKEAIKEWYRLARDWSLELAPKDQLGSKEWMKGFVDGFTGYMHKHL